MNNEKELIKKGIESSAFFRGISPLISKELTNIALIKESLKDEIIFFQNEEAQGFYLVLSGSIKIYRTGKDGREQIIHIFGSGQVFGEVPVFEGSNYPASAQSLTRVKLIYFSKNSFYSLARKNPDVLLGILAVLSMRLRKFVNLIDDLSLKDVSARLAKYIKDTSLGKPAFYIKESKTELAARIGTISATLSRTFKKMQSSGIIKVKSSLIEIIDKEKLEKLIETDQYI
jgi:CRP/FNR family transcriptional regulator